MFRVLSQGRWNSWRTPWLSSATARYAASPCIAATSP